MEINEKINEALENVGLSDTLNKNAIPVIRRYEKADQSGTYNCG